jgi:hypothetical protein
MEGRGEGEGGTGRRRRRRVKAVQGVEEHTRIGTHKAYGRSEGQFWVGVVILMCGLVDETPCANCARYPPPSPHARPRALHASCLPYPVMRVNAWLQSSVPPSSRATASAIGRFQKTSEKSSSAA